MAGTLRFELVTPERVALSGEAERVVVPGLEGQFTVLSGHAPLISALRPGMIEVGFADAPTARVFVKGGVAEVDGEHLTILAERALEEQALDAQTLSAEIAAAQADLAAANEDTARLAAASALAVLETMRR
jgi:F-type H+-transporting ATPase subunit epsilon